MKLVRWKLRSKCLTGDVEDIGKYSLLVGIWAYNEWVDYLELVARQAGCVRPVLSLSDPMAR